VLYENAAIIGISS